MFPSSLLGNVYLHSLDSLMLREGYDYHRYMDDVRIEQDRRLRHDEC